MHSLKNLWDVLLLFFLPIGGGIPAGVMLAQKRGFEWPVMMLLYLFSDVILACAFEPFMLLFMKYGKRIQFFARVSEVMKLMIAKSLEHYGNSTGIFPLIMIAFGADPMTGRAVALAAGHGFFVGWMIAIAGDMIYFTVVMASTLWLKSIVGDGTWTMIIIFTFMMMIPIVFRRIQQKFQKNK
ncbi:MAG: hypothetical protein H7281_04330 [Bacteriovorax sp.]|nr:hypothetical protein [Bacteriovorax sp.]